MRGYCKNCGENFEKDRVGQKCCSSQCALEWVEQVRVQNEKTAARAKLRAYRLTDKAFRTKKAQEAFNAFVRMRDRGAPCISCGHTGNRQRHAGHYRPVGGQASALRFNELNCHSQCSICNNHKSGNLADYRIGLIKLIGLDLVEWLEKEHKPCKWTCEELLGIEQYYKNAKKLLEEPTELSGF